MKNLAVVFCIVLGLAIVQGKVLLEVHNKCQSVKETHVDEEVFRKLRENIEVSLPPNFNDHMLCMSKEAGFQKADNSLDKDVIKQKIQEVIKEPTKVEQILNECSKVKENAGKTANDLFECLRIKAGITVLKN